MKKLYLFALLFVAMPLFGQTTCSTTNPCVQVSVTNSFMATNPGTATIYVCTGAATSCSQSALNSFIASPGVSVWKALGPFPQAVATLAYNDPEPYGALMNYAALNSTTAGGPGPVSAILIFQMPTSPVPPAPSLSVKSVTSGNTGVQ